MKAPKPSNWFLAHQSALHKAASIGPVVDLASGSGRHTRFCTEALYPSIAIDLNHLALQELRQHVETGNLMPVLANLEEPGVIPLQDASCGAVLVFRFLFRPLFPEIERILRPGGLLLYETFTSKQKDLPYGPSTERFLLKNGELARAFAHFEILDYFEGQSSDQPPNEISSLAAVKRNIE